MDYHPNLKKLRTYWQFANVCQYFLMFYLAYGLENFETDEFEAALIRQDKEVLTFYIVKLLRNINSGRNVNSKTWEAVFHREITNREFELPLPEEISKDFFELTLFQQVVCLQYLTELQFRDSAEKIRKASEEEEFSQDWRVKPIGQDVRGNDYYLFDDNRLYLSKPQPRPPKTTNNKALKTFNNKIKQAIELGESSDQTWEPLCITLEDWEEFSQKFSNSRYEIEKDLHETLEIDILPKVIPELKYKLRRQRKLAEAAQVEPKRSSRLQVKEAMRLQEEQEKERLRQLENPEIKESPDSAQPTISRREFRSRKRQENALQRLPSPKAEEEHSSDPIEQLDSLLEGEWIFACICGKGGKNFDDGTQQIACEKCGVWEHIKCQKFTTPTGKPLRNFSKVVFVCRRCKDPSQDNEENSKTNGTLIDKESSSPISKVSQEEAVKTMSLVKDSQSSTPEKVISPDVEASITMLLGDSPKKLPVDDGLSSSPTVSDKEDLATLASQPATKPDNVKPVVEANTLSSKSPKSTSEDNVQVDVSNPSMEHNGIDSSKPEALYPNKTNGVDSNKSETSNPSKTNGVNNSQINVVDSTTKPSSLDSSKTDSSNISSKPNGVAKTQSSSMTKEPTNAEKNPESQQNKSDVGKTTGKLPELPNTKELPKPDEKDNPLPLPNSNASTETQDKISLSDDKSNDSATEPLPQSATKSNDSITEPLPQSNQPLLPILTSDPKRSRCETEEPWHETSPSKKSRPSI